VVFTAPRPALGPIQSPIKWVPGAVSGSKAAGVGWGFAKMTTHLHLVPGLSTSGAIPPSPHVCKVWCSIKSSDDFIVPFTYEVESQPTFRGNISPPSSGSKNKSSKIPARKQVASIASKAVHLVATPTELFRP
jgi:hypothetical protein